MKKAGIDFEQGGHCTDIFSAVASSSQIVHLILDCARLQEFFEGFHESGMPNCVKCLRKVSREIMQT